MYEGAINQAQAQLFAMRRQFYKKLLCGYVLI